MIPALPEDMLEGGFFVRCAWRDMPPGERYQEVNRGR